MNTEQKNIKRIIKEKNIVAAEALVAQYLSESYQIDYIYPEILGLLYLLTEAENVMAEDLFHIIEQQSCLCEKSCTLMIRFYCTLGKIHEAIQLLDNMKLLNIKPHVRTYIPLLEHASNIQQLESIYIKSKKNECISLEVFENIFQRLNELKCNYEKWCYFFSEYSDIFYTISRKIYQILKTSFPLDIVEVQIPPQQASLGKEKSKMASILFEKSPNNFKDFDTFIAQRTYDIVIDGANVGHSDNGKFNPIHILRIAQYFLEQGKKVLVVLHHSRKHEIFSTFAQISKNIYFYWSPNKISDDWMWLYASLVSTNNDIKFVTNDQMRDHAFHLFPEYFRIWADGHRIQFELTDKNCNISYPYDFYRVCQKINGRWYFPIENKNAWLTLF